MKIFHPNIRIFLLLLFELTMHAQTPVIITNRGVDITIVGVEIYNCGKIINKDTLTQGINRIGLFSNDGGIHLKSDIENKSTSSFFSDPNGAPVNGRVYFEGNGTQSILGDSSIKFYKVFVSKIGLNDTIVLGQNIFVKDTFKFGVGNVFLNGKNVELGNTGKLISETNSSRVFGSVGKIKFWKTTISSPNFNENYGGLGLMIKNPGITLGKTYFERGHAAQTGCADGSILRYYNFSPTISGNRATFRFSYFNPNEITVTNPGSQVIWTSTDNGISWINRGRADSSQYVIGDTIPVSTMRITAADANCDFPPVVSINPGNVSKCAGDSAILDAGTFPSATYLWTKNGVSYSTSQTITVKTPGNYVVTVKTINGCFGKDSVNAAFNAAPTARFSFVSKCELDSTIFNASTSSGANLKYLWDFGDGFVGTGVNPKHEYISNGWKTVSLRALDSLGGCFDDTIIQVPVYALPIADFQFSNFRCKESQISFNNISTVPAVPTLPSAMTYLWNFADGSANSSLTNPTHSYTNNPTDSTTYPVRLIVTTSFGCKDTLIKNVFVNPLPQADFLFSANSCLGSSTNFINNSSINSGTISSYHWDFGDGTSFTGSTPPLHNYASVGTFSVSLLTISDSLCRDTISKTLNINPKPTAAFSINNACEGSQISFNNQSSIIGGTIGSYQWDFGDGSPTQTSAIPQKTYNISGNYVIKLVVISSTGCSDSISIPISIFPKPIASFTTSNVCLGQTSIFTNSSSISDSSPLSYVWNLGDGTNQTTMNVNHLYPGIGNYNVSLITTSNQLCRDTFSTTVSVNALPVANFSLMNNCQEDQSYFTNTSTGATSYFWDFGNGNNSTLTNPSLVFNSSGNYSIKLVTANSFGCKDSIIKPITIFPKPVALFNVNNQSICLGTALNLTNSSSIVSGSIVSNSWDFGDGTSSFIVNPIKQYNSTGNFLVQLVITSNKGCKDTTDLLVNVISKPLVNFSIVQNCGNDSVFLINTTNPISGSNYQWNFGDGNTSNLINPAIVYSNPGSYIVKLVASNPTGCSDSISKTVIYPTTPNTQFTFSNACTGQIVSFTNSSSIGIGSLTYNWDFGDGTSNVTTPQPTHTYNLAGLYTVQLISTSQSGCKDTLSQQITIGSKPSASFSIPLSFCQNAPVSITNSTLNSNTNTPYFWDFGDGSSSSLINPIKQFSTTGIFTISLIAGSGAQCSDTISKTISIIESPVANFVSDTVCLGNNTNFTNSSSISNGTLSFNWDFANFNYSTQINPSNLYSSQGNYPVKLICIASNGCSDTLVQNAIVKSVPVINLGTSISTCGNSYVLDAQNPGSNFVWDIGATSQTITVNNDDVYTVTVSSPNGCSKIDSVQVFLNSSTKPQLGPDTIACGSLILNAGYPNSSYLWSTGSTNDSILVNIPGSYIVSVTDQNNCSGSDTIIVQINAQPSLNLGSDTTLCTGEILNTGTSQTGYTYLWSNTSTASTINITNNGLYWLEITDQTSQCSSRDSIIVLFNPIPNKPFGNDTSACNSIILNANNLGASYLWNDGSSSQFFNALNSGSYDVLVTNSFGCSTRDTINVSVNNVQVNLGSNQAGCRNAITPLDAGTASSYSWSTGETTQTIQPQTSGLYSVVITDNIGCTGSGSVFINVFPSPLKPFGNDTTVCSGISLNASNQGSTYLWTGSGNGTTQSIFANATGQYIVDITSLNSCVTSDTINITINIPTPINLGNDTILCQGNPLSLNAGSAANYLWSTGATTQTIDVSLSATYIVSAANASGCSSSDTIIVSFKPSPIVNLGLDTASCGSYALNAFNTGLSYLWNNGSTNQTITANNTGLYYVDVTGLNSCISRDSIVVTINPNPIVNFGSTTLGCSGDGVLLDAGNPGGIYNWNTGATTQTITVNTSGFYQVNLTDNNGCNSIANTVVTFNNKPTFNLGPDRSFCGSAILNAGNPGSNFLWNNGSTTQTINASVSGNYFVTITNQYSCFITDSINLIINPLPVFNLGNDTSFCQGNSLTLNAGNPGSTYLWNNGSTSQSIVANVSGNYFAQVTDVQNCLFRDTISIVVANKPVVNLGVDKTLCRGSSITLNAGNPGATYAWGSDIAGFTPTTQIVTITDTANYWVNVSNGIGCSSSDTIKIRLDDNYVVAKFLSASSAFTGDTLVFINLSYPNPQSYLWDFSDGITTNQESPLHIFYTSNTFPVKLSATKLNCTDTIIKNINIQPRTSAPRDSIVEFIAPQIIDAIVYPNPTTGSFNLVVNLNVTSDLSIQIYDLQGRLITYKAIKANTYQEIYDLEKFNAGNGIYFINLITGKDRKTLKLIKIE